MRKLGGWDEKLYKKGKKSCKLGVKCILVAFKGGKLERRDHSVCRRRGKYELCLPQRPCLWKRDMEGTCSERRGPNMTNTRAEPKNFPKYLTPTGGETQILERETGWYNEEKDSANVGLGNTEKKWSKSNFSHESSVQIHDSSRPSHQGMNTWKKPESKVSQSVNYSDKMLWWQNRGKHQCKVWKDGTKVCEKQQQLGGIVSVSKHWLWISWGFMNQQKKVVSISMPLKKSRN